MNDQERNLRIQIRVVALAVTQRRLPLDLAMERLRPLIKGKTEELLKKCSDVLFQFSSGVVTLDEVEEIIS